MNIETIKENHDGSYSVIETTPDGRASIETFTSWEIQDCENFINAPDI